MPHSSGGGSHGGGSHGGSSFGGGSYGGWGSHDGGFHDDNFGGGSYHRPMVSRHYYPGARTFYYYNHGTPVYVYSNCDPKMYKTPLIFLLFPVGFMLIFIFMLISVLVSSYSSPTPLDYTSQYQVIIEDNANVLDDTYQLELTLNDFKDETGITPMIVTTNNENWSRYDSLENYAYELYVNEFEDETHWLLVYSEPTEPDSDFNEWYFAGIQGNDTDYILTSAVTSEFNEKLYTNLLKYDNGVDDAFVLTFEEITPDLMKTTASTEEVLPIYIMIGVMSLFIVFTIIGFKKKNTYADKEFFEVTDDNNKPEGSGSTESSDTVKEDIKTSDKTSYNTSVKTTCPYCRGEYIKGAHKECPHCGVFIPPEE